MKNRLGAAVLASIFSCAAYATNWLQLQGNEAPSAPAFRVFGFIQPTYTWIEAEPVTTLQGAAAVHNGKYSTLNLNWPDLQHPHQFQMMRAGLGVRGKFSDEINYFVALDAGENGTTYYHDVVLTTPDFHPSWRAHLCRAVRCRPAKRPCWLSIPPRPMYNPTQLYMLVGLPVISSGASMPAVPPAPIFPVVFRIPRLGVQVRLVPPEQWEYSYAAMLSNGDAI
jgi:hypothetical protein